MKKTISIILVILMLIAALFALTGCGQKNVELDLEKARQNIAAITSDDLNLSMADEKISTLQIPGLSEATFIYDFDFEKYGITAGNLQELGYRFVMNEQTKDFYAIFLPVEGKKDAVKQEMDSYIEKLKTEESDATIKAKLDNMKYEEYQGYLIYIVSENNDAVLNAIKEAKAPILSAMTDVPVDQMESVIGLKQEDVTEFLMEMPMMITNSNTYIVVKPADGKKEKVKETIENYMKNLENQWVTYLPDQYEIVKNRMEREYGDYLIYVATTDNEKIYNAIINSTK